MASGKARSKQRAKAPAGKAAAAKGAVATDRSDKGPAGKGRAGKGGAAALKDRGPHGRPERKPGGAATADPFPRVLLGAGLLIGLYAMLPAFYTGGIHLKKSVELVDHVVPGVIVLAVVMVAVIKAAKPDTLMLSTGVVVLLAGFWMAATHYGLLSQAIDNQANKFGTLYHCSTAVAVGALGIAWVYRYRGAGSGVPDRRAAAARRF